MTMRIRTTDLLGGQSIIAVRKLVRREGYYRGLSASIASDELHLSKAAAQRVIGALLEGGYLEPNDDRQSYDPPYRLTDRGVSLANATAAAPIRRETADRLVAGLVDRVCEVEAPGCPFAYGVKRLIVFGSYLSDAPKLNDLDIAVELAHRFADRDAQHEASVERAERWQREGHRFSNVSQYYGWAEIEVLRFIKGRSHAISLHDLTGDKSQQEFVAGIAHRVLYER